MEVIDRKHDPSVRYTYQWIRVYTGEACGEVTGQH
jgi:hypothetical protein